MSATEAIARLRELRAKATAGPWESGALFDSDFRDILNADGDNVAYGFASSGTGILRPQDTAAIVAAMNSLPALLECAEALDGLLAGMYPNAKKDKTHEDFKVRRQAAVDAADAALQALALAGGGE